PRECAPHYRVQGSRPEGETKHRLRAGGAPESEPRQDVARYGVCDVDAHNPQVTARQDAHEHGRRRPPYEGRNRNGCCGSEAGEGRALRHAAPTEITQTARPDSP